MFVEGRKLMKAHRFAEACEKFESSQTLDPAVGTLMNFADCNEKVSRTASAWAQFREAAALAERTGDGRRARAAAQRAAVLETKLARLRIVTKALPSDQGFTVRVNDRELPAAAWDTAMPVDPGMQSVVVQGAGYLSWTGQQDVAAGTEVTMLVPKPKTAPAVSAALPAPEVSAVDAATTSKRNAPATSGTTSRAGVWVAGGATVAAVVLGGAFAYLANDRWSGVSTGCRSVGACEPQERSDAKSAQSAGTISTIAFASAGVAAIVAGILWLQHARAEPPVQVLGWLDPSSVGASLTGRF